MRTADMGGGGSDMVNMHGRLPNGATVGRRRVGGEHCGVSHVRQQSKVGFSQHPAASHPASANDAHDIRRYSPSTMTIIVNVLCEMETQWGTFGKLGAAVLL